MIALAVWIQYMSVTRQMDRPYRPTAITVLRLTIASRGKKLIRINGECKKVIPKKTMKKYFQDSI